MKTNWVVFALAVAGPGIGCGSDSGTDDRSGDEATTPSNVSPPSTPAVGTGGMAPMGTGGGVSSSGAGTGTGGGAMQPEAGPGGMGADAGSGLPGTGGAEPDSGGTGTGGSDPSVPMITGNFSFFTTSIEAIRMLSGSEMGFGGNLGGLSGADSICQRAAAKEGAGHKTWRAFLSATSGGAGGGPVHAINRIGEGPWYDRQGRLVAMNKAGLTSGARPAGDSAIASALTNERGEPLGQNDADDHDILTGSSAMGMLQSNDPARTCNDWTSAEVLMPMSGGGGSGFGGGGLFPSAGPMLGHAWPAMSGQGWIQAHAAPGCTAGIVLEQNGPPAMGSTCVGCGGGYGGIYCFALEP